MSFTIEQDLADARLAYSLQCKANMQLMQLITASAKCNVPFLYSSKVLKVTVVWKAEPAAIDDRILRVPVKFAIKVLSGDDLAVSVQCIFRADYELAPDHQPTKEEVEAFRTSNAVFNCWPYFREFAQNMLSRMNYPPLSIPFLRLIPKPKARHAVIEVKESDLNHGQPSPEPTTRKAVKKR